MIKAGSQNLTEGSIIKNIVIFAMPLLLSEVFQSLYNSVDSIIVGNFVGKTALAAVTACSDISQLLVGFFVGLSAGSGIVFSRFFGGKQYDKLHDAIHTAILFAAVLGFGMATLGILIAPLLLNMVDCPSDVYGEALIYLRIYLVGIFFTSLYNVAAGVLRAVGDSKNPFYYLLASSCTHICLDITFVRFLNMGVEGVALATVLSQGLSSFLVFRNMLTTKDVYRLKIRELKIDKSMLVQIIKFGLPTALQQCIISFSNLFLQKYINGFGSSAMAGIGAAKKVERYASLVTQSLGLATTTFIAQNIGAKKPERAFKALKYIISISFAAVFITGLPIYIYADVLIKIFTKDAEAIMFGAAMVTTMLPFYFVQAINNIFGNCVRGFGYSLQATIMSICGLVVIRQIFLAIAMHFDHNIVYVYLSWPVGWTAGGLLSMLFFWFKIRRPYKKAQKLTA